MTMVTSLRIDVFPSDFINGFTEFRVEVRIGFDNGVERKVYFGQMYDTDNFNPMWERMMDRTKEEVRAAVRNIQEELNDKSCKV